MDKAQVLAKITNKLRDVESEIDKWNVMQRTNPNEFAARNGHTALHWWRAQQAAYLNCLNIISN